MINSYKIYMIQRLNKHFKIQLKKKGQTVFLSFLNKTHPLQPIKIQIKINLINKSLNLKFKNHRNSKLPNKTKTMNLNK